MDDRDIQELHRIWELKEKGAISEEEYSRLKKRILDGAKSSDDASERQTVEPLTAVSQAAVEASSSPSAMSTGKQSCLIIVGVIFALLVIAALVSPSTENGAGNSLTTAENLLATDANASASASPGETSPWSYSQDEDKVRGGTTYYASTTSTNSIAQDFPYDSNTTMRLTVRKSPAYGTDVILTISSGQMMCPSYEGCSGTVRFDDGPAQRVSFSGPEDNSTETVFVDGAKSFIAKLKKAKRVTIEKTLYQAGSPQFEFDVHGLKWDH